MTMTMNALQLHHNTKKRSSLKLATVTLLLLLAFMPHSPKWYGLLPWGFLSKLFLFLHTTNFIKLKSLYAYLTIHSYMRCQTTNPCNVNIHVTESRIWWSSWQIWSRCGICWCHWCGWCCWWWDCNLRHLFCWCYSYRCCGWSCK
jgi:hypothetical protein